jgi:Transcriptional regulators
VPKIDVSNGENAADAAHARLRDAILSGEYRPNYRLVEEELATVLKVSRTPVREALLRLKQEGLVAQHKGWLVRDHPPAEILEFLEARAALESATARLAGDRIDAETLSELADLIEQMEDPAKNRREVNALNTRFHGIITDAGGNNLLASFTRGTNINYWNFSTPIIFTDADDALVNSDHRELYEALKRHDGEAAATIARRHVDHTGNILARALGLEPDGAV